MSEPTVKKVILQSPVSEGSSANTSKYVIDQLVPVLTKIVNSPILEGKMPTAYKKAVLMPLIKNSLKSQRHLSLYK